MVCKRDGETIPQERHTGTQTSRQQSNPLRPRPRVSSFGRGTRLSAARGTAAFPSASLIRNAVHRRGARRQSQPARPRGQLAGSASAPYRFARRHVDQRSCSDPVSALCVEFWEYHKPAGPNLQATPIWQRWPARSSSTALPAAAPAPAKVAWPSVPTAPSAPPVSYTHLTLPTKRIV